MNKNIDILEEKKLSDVIFSLLPENNIITNRAFLYAFKGNFLKASMLSRYTHCFLKNNNQEITYKDKTFEEQYYCPEISVKRAKKELKDEGFITVVQKGLPAVGYIAVNIEKVAEILGNFKRYQIDTTGSINLIPHIYNNKINNILSDFGQKECFNDDDKNDELPTHQNDGCETIQEYMRPLQDGAKSTSCISAGAPTINKEIYKENIKENIKRKVDLANEKGGKGC